MTYLTYFTKTEWALWLSSVTLILTTNLLFGSQSPLALTASLIGVTSLVFNAKANPIGQGLVIVFSLIYAYLALLNGYYGELLTYTLMTLPMAIFSLFSWLTHPFEGNKSQVTISRLRLKDWGQLVLCTLVVTTVFYFILAYFNTNYLLVSTLSIATSFSAVFLSYKRSPFFALAYSLNDLVLILLWLYAARQDIGQYAIVSCFVTFFVNDIYTFTSWLNLRQKQEHHKRMGH